MARKPKAGPPKKPAAVGSGAPAVRVRMYRQGLGDCFLITFDAGGDERHMLIDCGTLGAKATGVSMGEVVDHIAQTTKRGGKSTLDVLVATHAHKDHVSGFLSQKAKFQGFAVANVWMGWTEDPSDALARKLGNTAKKLRAAIAGAFGLAPASGPLRGKLAGLLEFEGGEIGAGGLAMGDTIADALDVVRTLPGARVTYHSPGGPAIELPTIPGFRFYMLGPPRDEAKISSMGDHGSDELYGLTSAMRAAGEVSSGGPGARSPFDARFCHPLSAAAEFYPAYNADSERTRRIDGDWTRAAAEAAATLDRFRNNTSLALAIERIEDGRVLLFPADAQQGNWLSWHDPGMEWKVKERTAAVKAADLLGRTVFYKVGHHASHNATAKGKGLEIMRAGRNLTAFIPVDREVALSKSPPGSWRMPAVALYRELLDACEGRVARADLGWVRDAKKAARPDIEKELAGVATAAEWEQWGRSQAAATNVKEDRLFIEYVLE